MPLSQWHMGLTNDLAQEELLEKCINGTLWWVKRLEVLCLNQLIFHSTDEYLVGSVMHLLIGGSVSVASHIHWHMLNCAHNMDTLQERIQSEIDRVVGAERQPEWEDRHRMPFTMATVWEMYRRKPGSNLPRGWGYSPKMISALSSIFRRLLFLNVIRVRTQKELLKDTSMSSQELLICDISRYFFC